MDIRSYNALTCLVRLIILLMLVGRLIAIISTSYALAESARLSSTYATPTPRVGVAVVEIYL